MALKHRRLILILGLKPILSGSKNIEKYITYINHTMQNVVFSE